MKRSALVTLLLLGGAVHAAERVPVAVVWLGDAGTLDEGGRIATEVGAALSRAAVPTARPLDSAADRKALIEGGPATAAEQMIARGDLAFAKLRFSDAARQYAAAEQLLLSETPIAVAQRRLGAVERALMACFDQMAMPEDAARAAERLSWTAGENSDVKALLDRHHHDRRWETPLPPVHVVSVPEGAQVYRDSLPIGAAPIDVRGGEPSLDVLDVELLGYRRAHVPLGSQVSGAGAVEIKLEKEDRLGVLVDDLRAQSPEPPAGQVVVLGRRVGAARVLVLSPEGPARVRARWVDVAKGDWGGASVEVDSAGQPAMDRLAQYAAPAPPAGAVVIVAKQPTKAAEKPKSAWGKWYTWVAAGGVLVLIGTLLIVDRVGDDKLTVKSSH